MAVEAGLRRARIQLDAGGAADRHAAPPVGLEERVAAILRDEPAQMFLRRGADPYALDDYGRTPLKFVEDAPNPGLAPAFEPYLRGD